MVKTLIFESKQGERVLVMVGGDQSAISGHLKKVIGSRNIKLASPETVIETHRLSYRLYSALSLATQGVSHLFRSLAAGRRGTGRRHG